VRWYSSPSAWEPIVCRVAIGLTSENIGRLSALSEAPIGSEQAEEEGEEEEGRLVGEFENFNFLQFEILRRRENRFAPHCRIVEVRCAKAPI
jgi:hypothetical protein